MKIHFEPDLDYQRDAIEAVCDLFRGQEISRSEFTVTKDSSDLQTRMEFAKNDRGHGNKLSLLDDEILKNLRDIQIRNGIKPSRAIDSGDFTVEMETGTGKTYVYLRTAFELNQRFGFTKFIIVVPSVAIKEGVFKSIQMMEEHFKALYSGVPFDAFIYDSGKPGQVRNFATSPNLQFMVMTVQSIVRKDYAVIYKDSEKTGGEKPIDLIRATLPIVIIDEPQSVEGGLEGRGRQAIGELNPLCKLRYSATPREAHHLVFKLDSVDAYERKLVKQIEVASPMINDAFNRPYIRFVSVKATRGAPVTVVEIDKQNGNSVSRVEMRVQDGDDLELLTSREIYRNHSIGEVRAGKGNELLEIKIHPGQSIFLRKGEIHGAIDQDAISRQMIRRTIKAHLDKELRLAPLGIKVLSLFFINTVANYRSYGEDGQPIKGPFATIFEQEYARAIALPEYQTLFHQVDTTSLPAQVHDGYFSIDKTGDWMDTSESNENGRQGAERAYNLIMKEKEKLLSFSTHLKFIFSHSALREGWDNPNVFQICSLRDMTTETQRRQTIGRGLRLCVNQDGERVRGFSVNTLTVIASENYADYAERLQRETEEEMGIKFGVVDDDHFAAVAIPDASGELKPLEEQSQTIWAHLKEQGYIDASGKVQDALRTALKNNTLNLPAGFEAAAPQIEQILRKLAGKLEIKNADEKVPIPVRKAVLIDSPFKELWDRIKHRTTFRVEFDNTALIAACSKSLQQAPAIPRATLVWQVAELGIGRSGIDATEVATSAPVAIEENNLVLPDILTELQNRTQLTRRSIATILTSSGRLDDFKRNPQLFIDIASEAINRAKQLAIVDGIKYHRIGEDEFYAQELFETEELFGYLSSMMPANKAVHEQIRYDSDTEKTFAEQLEKNDAIKVYAKLPSWFQVPTPLGTYNPDWAIVVEKDGIERLYFVVETKSSLFAYDRREKENAKIKCGKAHFVELATHNTPAAQFVEATNLGEVFAKC
jgi:type III restriction enzyme